MKRIRKFYLFILVVFAFLNSKAQSLSIIWPKSNEVISNRMPLLSWNGEEGVSNYQLSISQDSTFISGVQQFSTLASPYQLTSNLASGTWFWKVNIPLNSQDFTSNLGKFQVFEPTDIPSLKLWLSDSVVITNNQVSQWIDLSGNNNHFIQNTVSFRPNLLNDASVGNRSMISFDGVNDFLTNSFSTNIGTLFTLASWNGVQSVFPSYNGLFSSMNPYNYLLVGNINSSSFYLPGGSILSSSNLRINSSNSINFNPLQNLKIISGKLNTSQLFNNLIVGKDRDFGDRFWNGNVGEIIAYSSILNNLDLEKVELFIKDRYFPPVNLGPDRNSIYLNNGSCVNETLNVPIIYSSYEWSTGANTNSIQVTQPGSYWVKTIDIFGRTSRDTIVVNNPKMNIFNFQDTIVCFNDSLTILPSIPFNHSFTQWKDENFNANRAFTLADANNSYSILFTSNTSCLVESNKFQIKIDSTLQHINLGADTALCSNNFIQISGTPNIPLSYLWNSNNTNVSEVIQSAGVYWVHVTNSNGCSISDTIEVTISGEGPIVNFVIPSSACVGASIELTAQGTILSPDSIDSLVWNFGNSFVALGDSVTTSYSTTGIKQVQLTALASNGCQVVLNQAIQVFQNPTVTILTQGSCIFDTVSFSTQNNGFNIQNYFWNLGQNITSTSTTPSHVYNASGTFPISVISSDQNGCIDTSYSQLILSESLESYSNTISVIWPKSNEVISDRTPLLSWNGVEGVLIYQVSISLDSTFSSGIQQFSSSTTSYQLTNSLVSGTWFWKLNATVNGQSYVSNLGKFQIFQPSDIASLKLWLSDSVVISNNQVSQWIDLSGNNNHFIQNSTSFRPNLLNNGSVGLKPVISLDGVNDFLTCSSSINIGTLFSLAGWNGGQSVFPSYNGLFSSFNPFNYIIVGDLNTSSFYLPNASLISSSNLRINSSNSINFSPLQKLKLISGKLNSTQLFTNFTIGQDRNFGDRYWNGNVGEIIAYSTILNNMDLEKVELFINDRYFPPVNLGPDRNSIYLNNGTCVNETLNVPNIYSSYVWSTGAITQSIQVNQPGSYWVQATDIFGRISRDTIVVNNPKMNIFSDEEYECFNGPRFLTANVPQNHSFIRWNNCNPSTMNQIHAGNYYFVEFQNAQGCIVKSNLFSVGIDSSLTILTLGADTLLCSGNNIQLQNHPSGITNYSWNTGNTQAMQTVDTSGFYILEVTNTNNCQNRDTIEVTIIGTSPNLQFAFSDTLCQFSPGGYLDNSFVPNGNGTISSKTWSISQGDTLIGSSGSFSIDSSGTFNVTLLVQTQEGCSSSATFPLVVHPKPIVSFSTEKFCPYDAVEFTPSNSQLSSLSSQLWSFDDNTTSTSPNPTHVFGTTDTYNVSLQAEDINGCRDTVVQPVYIQPQPVADFTFNNSCEQSAVNFVNNSSITDTFSLSMSQWSYGDGTQVINPSVQKVYQAYGDYDVQLVVTANNGCQDTLTQTITIHPKPILGWQLGPACKNTWTTFENQSTIPLGSITQTDWLVNLQYPLEGTNSAYKFVTTGVQYLNLTSTSDQGCTTDTLIIVNVQPEINAAYTVSPTTVVAGVSVVFTNNSIGGTSYEWNLGNGNIIQTPVAEPVEATGFASSFIGDSILTYLAIQNAIGCKDTAYQYVKVNEPRIDLAINQLFVQDINGFYKVGVELRNLGFVEITQTDLLLKLYNSSPILETETESLAPGESRIYLFNANPSAFVSTQDKEISYLCVEAKSYNDYQLIETELSNNISCLNTEGENFVLLPIYPNPTNDDVTYTLIVSEESTISASLTDETGRIVQSSTELFASGLHTPTISMRNLSAGVYYFHISDGVTSKTVKILKN